MTTKKKKPFWVKLLSAVLVASMLIGNAGMSSFAAADSPDEKGKVEETVSDESAGGKENTAGTPETGAAKEAAQDLEDTGTTGAGKDTKTPEGADVSDAEGNLQSKEEAGKSDAEDNQQSKEEAGKSDVEESLKDKAEGDVSSETGDENAPSDATDTENGGVNPGTSDAVNDLEKETEELPETESVYASLEEFLAAVAAVGEVDEAEDLLEAIDNCLSIYDKLSPEDKEAQSEAYEYIASYREQVAAGNPDEGIEELALTTGHTQSMKFTILYISDEFRIGYNYSGGATYPFTCQDSEGHSGYNHTILISEIWNAINQASVEPGWEIVGWAKGLYPDKNVTIYTQKTGTTYASSSNYYFMGVAKRATSVDYTVKHHYRINNKEVAVDTTTGTGYKGTTIYGSNFKQTNYGGKDYNYNSSSSTYSIVLANSGNVLNLYYDRTEQEQQYYARVVYNSNAGGDTVTGMPGEYKYVGADKSPSYTLSGNIPARSGYVFKGWSIVNGENNAANKVSGSVTLNTSTTPDGPIHRYYAIWEKINPRIKVTKTVNGSSEVKPGDTVNFSIKVENTGNVEFNMVAVSDILPEGLTYVSATGSPMTTTPYIVWILQKVAAGEVYTFDVAAKVDNDVAGTLTNTVSAKGQTSDNAQPEDTDSASVTVKAPEPVVPNKTFRLVKEFKGLDSIPDDFNISYDLVCADTTNGTLTSSGTLTCQNGAVDEDAMTVTWQVPYFYGQKLSNGNNATNVLTITESCDVDGYTYESSVKKSSYITKNTDGTITCTVSSIASGVTRVITNTYTESTPIVDNGNGVSIEKNRVSVNGEANKTTAEKGDKIVWSIKVTNHSNVSKIVKLSEELTGAVLSKNEVTLEPGKFEIISVEYTVTGDEELKDGKLYNTVSGTTGGEGEKENPKDTDEGTEIDNKDERAPKLKVEKTVDNATPKAGETVTYSIKVENTGDADASEVKVTDELDGNLTFESWALGDTESTAKPVDNVYQIGELKAGESVTLTIRATVKEGVAAETEILNTATGDYEGKPEGEEPKGEVTITVEDNDTEPENPTDPTEPTDPENPTDPTEPVIPGGGDGGDPDPTPTPPGGGGGGTNPEPTPATPEPAPTTPEPTPIVPEPVPTVGPVQTVPTATPVAPTSTVPTPTAALASPTPEMAELSDEDVPLAGEGEKEEPETVIKPAELKDEAVPMAAGKGLSWALINFALMNLAVFESLMLLIGYFIKTKGSSEEDEEEKKKLKKKGIMRIISLPVAVISVIAFILTEDITLPTAFVDRYTILMAVIAIVQTAVAALSRKEVKDEEEQKAEA